MKINTNHLTPKNEAKSHFQIGYDLARKHLLTAKEKSKLNYDKNAKERVFHVGEKILLQVKNRSNKKLTSCFEGPYEIMEILSPLNSKIKIGRKEKIIHNNMIKTFVD